MATSTIPLVKAALRDALVARSGLAGVTVSWGLPNNPDASPELIVIGDVEGDQVAAALGARKRQEDYNLTVSIDVVRRDGSQEGGTLRCFEIAGEIENELRTNATLGVTGVLSAQVKGPVRLEELAFPDHGVRESYLELTIAVESRI